MSVPGPEILFERSGRLGVITLNRPQALNALTLPMIRALARHLAEWGKDPDVATLAIRGAGGKAFSAGGDIRALYDARARRRAPGTAHTLTADFYREEYRLDRAIFRCPKPYVALIDGIVMGGGVGVAINGRFRVVSERALFAMPETGIGLFPDVGASYFLSRLPGRIGLYLALTGARLKAADLIYCGLATHYVPTARLGELTQALGGEMPAAALERFAADPGPAPLAELREAIDRCFGESGVEAILAALERERADWADQTATALRQKAPLALKVASRQLERGAGLDFEDCMTMEYRLSQAFMAGDDFFEGVRALIIDKDMKPAWRPARLAEVDEAMVEACFAPLGPYELTFDG